MQYKDYYQIMGLSRDASRDEIKRAYRKLARKYHPDVSGEKNAEEKFKELGQAYEVLKDSQKRKEYDAIRDSHRGQDARKEQQRAQHAVDDDAFADFFNSIFGDKRQASSRPAYHGGNDIHAKLEISLGDSFNGIEKALELLVPFVSDKGAVEQKAKRINVKIPKGVIDKQQIRLKGQGGGIAGRVGDLYLEINIKPHKFFKVKNKDVSLMVPISPWEAVLGAQINVPTLGGSVRLKIPKRSQSGKQMRLAGRGLPGKPPGDQLVTLNIVIPEKENESVNSLYEALAEKESFNPRHGLGVSDEQ
jgi:curved DNA-binding protein